MKSWYISYPVLVIVFSLTRATAFGQGIEPRNNPEKVLQSDSTFFSTLVSQYVKSINDADTSLALAIWAKTADISHFNPQGTFYGWDGVKKVYRTFKDNFTSRNLTFSDLRYSYSNEVSWVTFRWKFEGTLKSTNQLARTRGLETQVWKKVNHEWRLVHVHYSEVPGE
ncbi:MAG TPA: nuclear transport factor 2 family protein [Bacteroidales bacterium]|nr:nuclear transport factor 2 family protein [Bacteroidales bacterium]